jgi:hypothetical protein
MMLRFLRQCCAVLGTLSLSSMFAAPPVLTVRMQAVAPVSPKVLDLAAAEAAQALRYLPVRLQWLNCSTLPHSVVCDAPNRPIYIGIRLLPSAIPPASRSALGMAMWSEEGGSAAVFYDRALSVRRPGLFLAQILGRAMAHEIVHLLLGTTDHFESGLMKSEWTAEDLRFDRGTFLEMTPAMTAAILSAAEQRIAGGDGNGNRGPSPTRGSSAAGRSGRVCSVGCEQHPTAAGCRGQGATSPWCG